MSFWTDLTGTGYRVEFTDAGGVPTRALRTGGGEHVVFLHGTSGHLEAFLRNIGPHAAGQARDQGISQCDKGAVVGPARMSKRRRDPLRRMKSRRARAP